MAYPLEQPRYEGEEPFEKWQELFTAISRGDTYIDLNIHEDMDSKRADEFCKVLDFCMHNPMAAYGAMLDAIKDSQPDTP